MKNSLIDKVSAVVDGYAITHEQTIIAALVLKLGGTVKLTSAEYADAKGLIVLHDETGIMLEASSTADLGAVMISG